LLWLLKAGLFYRVIELHTKRKMSLNELLEKVELTLSNLSILKTGKAKAIRFSTLEAICKALNCPPVDILE
jgi:putative transcriptional regulator